MKNFKNCKEKYCIDCDVLLCVNLNISGSKFENQSYVCGECSKKRTNARYGKLHPERDIPVENICKKCSIGLTDDNQRFTDIDRNKKICIDCAREHDANRYGNLKKLVITKLGSVCECCGKNEYETLTIDHIHGGGGKEKLIIRGRSYLEKLNNMSLEDLLKDFRCLCYNCNYCIGFYGKCQHKI